MSKGVIVEHINEHLALIGKIDDDVQGDILKVSKIISSSIQRGGTIFWCGNGGSSSDSQHLAAELVGRFDKERSAIRSISLTADSAVLTCISNDYGYENIFSRQIEALGKKGDVLVVISTSGNSKNVIKVTNQANKQNLITIGLLGKGGGEVMKNCDNRILIPSVITARIQEMHILIGHILCDLIEKELKLT